MTRFVAPITLCAALAALLLAGPAQARRKPKPKPTCATVGRTLAADASVRVYRRDRELANNDFTSPANYACWLPKHRSRFLGWVEDCTYPGGVASTFRLNGRLVAYAHEPCDVNAPSLDEVRVIDAKTGAVRADAFADTIRDIAFVGNHGVAWIEDHHRDLNDLDPARRQVRALDPFPCARTCTENVGTVLDTGAGIEKGSLAAGGRWIYWTRDGVPRSHRTGGLLGGPLPPVPFY